MKTLSVYQHIQLGFILLMAGMFVIYWLLDLLHYDLSDVSMGMFQAIWSIILLLVDPKGLVKIIQVANGIDAKEADISTDNDNPNPIVG